jgi:hypothetical protein
MPFTSVPTPELARRQAGAALVEALDVLFAALPRTVELARTEERAAERAAVVAWLREHALQSHPDAAGWFALNHASVMIERGLHRREEEP